jgi:hypothetical protein
MMLGWGEQQRSTAMSNKSSLSVITMDIDIGKYAFHVVGLDRPRMRNLVTQMARSRSGS